MSNEDLSTLCSDLLLQWERSSSKEELQYWSLKREDTLESFLHGNLNSHAKAYIYERDCPFMSKDTLKAYFGDIAFMQHTVSADPNTFNVRFVADCTEDKIRFLVSRFDVDSSMSRIVRLGLLRNFFSEPFEPFHETMKRILAMNPVKVWMKEALSLKSEKNKPKDLILSFLKGRLIAIL